MGMKETNSEMIQSPACGNRDFEQSVRSEVHANIVPTEEVQLSDNSSDEITENFNAELISFQDNLKKLHIFAESHPSKFMLKT